MTSLPPGLVESNFHIFTPLQCREFSPEGGYKGQQGSFSNIIVQVCSDHRCVVSGVCRFTTSHLLFGRHGNEPKHSDA